MSAEPSAKESLVPAKKRSRPQTNLLLDPADTLPALRAQVEFYLGDSNLCQDEYLLSHLRRTADVQWVNSDLILEFRRVRRVFRKAGIDPSQRDLMLEMLRKALADSSLVRVSEDLTRIERKSRFRHRQHKLSAAKKRKVVVEGFPEDVTQEMLGSRFAPAGTILSVKKKGDLGTTAVIEYKQKRMAEEAVLRFDATPLDAGEHSQKMKVSLLSRWRSELAAGKKSMKTAVTWTNPAKVLMMRNLPPHTTETTIRILAANVRKPDEVRYERGKTQAELCFLDKEAAEFFVREFRARRDVLTLGGRQIDIEEI